MIDPLQKGYKLNNQYTIHEVVGIGGNSMVYLVEDENVGMLLLKEYIYGLGSSDYNGVLRRLGDGCIAGDASMTFIDWLFLNEKQAKKEQEKLRELRKSGFVFYEAALQSFQANNTYYTPILNSKGTILKDCMIFNAQDLYHYTIIVLKAISNLHEKGYIHLDLSPDNLLITPYDVGFLIDFGSTKSLSNLDNEIMCKEEYAASEVLERIYYCDNIHFKNGELGVWSDIYSMGKVMLYLENQCINKEEYQEELKNYHAVALKASNPKSQRRFQTINQMQEVLEVQYEHMAYDRWKNRETILNKAESLRKELKYQTYSKDSYYYKNRNHLFVGRKEELEQIYQFEKEDKTFSFLTISAPAASGKSALIYHYVSKNIDQSNYRYVYLDGKELGEYEPRDLVYLGFDLMLVVDYVSGYYKEIAEFLEKAREISGNNKLRVVFVERDQKENQYPLWMNQLKPYTYHFNELISSDLYYKNIYLEALNKEEYEQIVSNDVYEKLVKIDTFKRPLYALMLSKMMEDQEINVENLTYINVLEYIVSKEEKRIKEICDKEYVDFDVWNQYYVLSTLCSYLDFDEVEINLSDSQLKNILTKINTNENGFILKGLEPDLIGEYYVLHYFKNKRKKTIQRIMKEAWQINAKATARALIHMEDDFGQIYRNEYLNEEILYCPYMVNDEYHALLKQLLLTDDMKQGSMNILEKHYEFYIKDDVLLEYNGTLKQLIVPNNVKAIGKLQGIHFSEVEEVIISDTVTTIKEKAFYYHPNLKKVTLGKNVTMIDDEAFKNCRQLKEVKANEKLHTIGRFAFEKTALHLFEFPHSLNEIKYAAFSECEFEKIVLPQSISLMGSYAFSYNKTRIKLIDYNCKLIKFGNHIFEGCQIENVCIKSSIVLNGLFTNVGLKYLTLNDGLKEIEANSFSQNKLINIVLPSSLEKIGDGAFVENEYLENVVFNEGLKFIGSCTFQKTALKQIELPKTLEELGSGCFSQTSCLESCVLNGTMTKINDHMFHLSHLQLITINSPIEIIGREAFKETNIESINFPCTLKHIETSAFEKCDKLRHVQFPKSLRIIGNSAFDGCVKISQLSLSEQITYIGSYAFYNTSIRKVKLPSSVNIKAFLAFNKDTKIIYASKEMRKMMEIEEKRMNDHLIQLSKLWSESKYNHFSHKAYPPRVGAHAQDDTIEELILKDKAIGIAEYSNCKNLKRVVLNEGIEQIKSFAFADCEQLNDILIPKSVFFIQDYVFANTNIKELIIPKKLYALGCIGYMKIKSLEISRNTKLKSYWQGNNYIYINDNPNLKWIRLYENNFNFVPLINDEKHPEFPHIFDNPQLEFVEVIFDKVIKDYEKINLFCEMQDYPFHFTNNSVILHAKDQNVTDVYNDFIYNNYIFEKFKEWES